MSCNLSCNLQTAGNKSNIETHFEYILIVMNRNLLNVKGNLMVLVAQQKTIETRGNPFFSAYGSEGREFESLRARQIYQVQ